MPALTRTTIMSRLSSENPPSISRCTRPVESRTFGRQQVVDLPQLWPSFAVKLVKCARLLHYHKNRPSGVLRSVRASWEANFWRKARHGKDLNIRWQQCRRLCEPVSFAVIIITLTAYGAVLPFAEMPLPRIDNFFPTMLPIIFVSDTSSLQFCYSVSSRQVARAHSWCSRPVISFPP